MANDYEKLAEMGASRRERRAQQATETAAPSSRDKKVEAPGMKPTGKKAAARGGQARVRRKKKKRIMRKWLPLSALFVLLLVGILLLCLRPSNGQDQTPTVPVEDEQALQESIETMQGAAEPDAQQIEETDEIDEADVTDATDVTDVTDVTDATEEEPSAEPVVFQDEAAEPLPSEDVAHKEMGEIVESAQPTGDAYRYQYRIVSQGKVLKEYERKDPISMGAGEDYAEVEGVLTFRGSNYRDRPAYGTVPNNASKLSVVWTKHVGFIDEWTGVGWTGQPSIVRWPEQTRLNMNINADKRNKDGLTEVIYATLDGNIYFLDLDDGQPTRDSIKVPSSIKGSVSVDARGYPLLYCGQGIPEVKGKKVEIGTRIFSLIDQKRLYFIDGHDDYCLRRWYAFDCSPLVDADSDTLIHLGENGIVYTIKLNTNYDEAAGTISIEPEMDRYVYKSRVTTRMGMENSPVVYDHYAYFTDNSGLLTCLDLNTLSPVWLGDVGDDSDSSIVLEEDEQGVWLYTACELDLNGLRGNIYCRKFNALTGEEIWKVPVKCVRRSESVDAGGFATPAIGKGSLSVLVYFNICRTEKGGGALAALNKETGEVVWVQSTGNYSWSSPVCVYDSNGRGYIIYGNSKGILKLCDGLTGEVITQIELDANIEASPAVFDDMLVVGTRGNKIYGVRIS